MSARCPVCAGADLAEVVSLPSVPVHANVLCPTREAARAMARAPMEVRACRDCGHVFNAVFDPELMRYDGAYENSLHCSGRFQQYAEELADGLSGRHALAGKRVVEIGCGDGRFLEMLAARGVEQATGFDPGARPADRPAGVTVHVGYYAPDSGARGDLVACRHVLEHIETPGDFVDLLATARADADGVLFVEVPNGYATLTQGMIWDLIYEHVSYFTARSLAHLLAERGFGDARLSLAFGGQFLVAEAKAGAGPARFEGGADGAADPAGLAAGFAERFWGAVEGWRAELRRHAAAGRTVVAWGAGSKGVSFLNLVDPDGAAIRQIVDLNPVKTGQHVAGAGQEIVGLDQLPGIAPDVVLLMNPIYETEVTQQLRELGLTPTVAVVGETAPRQPAEPVG